MNFSYRLSEETELRLPEPRYAEEIFALIDADRARLQYWLDWVEHTKSVDDSKAFCQFSLNQCAQGKGLIVGIWHRGRFAGTVGLEDINPFVGSAEIGYWLGEAFEGHGLITHACRAMIAHAFGALGLQRLQIRVQPTNARSRAVAQRLGFRHEGTLRQVGRIEDRRIDLDVFSLLREEWDGTSKTITFTHPLTGDTALRLLLPQDADVVYSLVDGNRTHLHWMSWIDGTRSADDISNFIRHALQQLAIGTEAHWGIWHREQFAGVIGTLPINLHARRADIGYWLGEEFQGKGLMTAAGQAVLQYLFEILKLERVEIRFRSTNHRSRAVAERLGFTREGLLRNASREEGQPADIVITALLREEWEARRSR